MKLSIIFIFGFLFFSYSQENNNNFNAFISISSGYSFGLNDFSGENEVKKEVDNLIGLKKNQFIFKLFGGVFHKNIGLEASLERGAFNLDSDLDIFDEKINNTFNSNYFVTINSKSSDPKLPYSRILAGPIYKFELSKFRVITKLLLGNTRFNLEQRLINLKERDSNNNILLSYTTNNSKESFFTIAPRVSFGYPISKFIFINLELGYNVFASDITYTKKTENIFLNEIISSEIINQEKLIHALDLNLNLIYYLN